MSALGEPKFAWEPLTPRGVAVFARASLERLFVVQAIFALLAAAVLVWVLSESVLPVIEDAIEALPDTGSIHGGRLDWRDDSPVMLAEGRLLAIDVDMDHGGQLRSPADFQIEFGRDSVVIYSLLGVAEIGYPPGYVIAANYDQARPAWGAWSPNIVGLAAIGMFVVMLMTWVFLAIIYTLPVWLVCFFANRDLGLLACYKLAGAAQMPGALLMTVALAGYGAGAFDLVQLLFAFGMHLVTSWIYLFVSPMFLNRALPAAKHNPFQK